MMKNPSPLEGKTVVITRAQHQAAEFSRLLLGLGAQVIEFPTIEIIPPESWAALDDALDRLHVYDWIIFTSVNGVRFFIERLRERGKSVEDLKGIGFCAIGPGTAREMEREKIEVHRVPKEYRAEALVGLLAEEGVTGKRVLLARAREARETLPEGLRDLGAQVDVVEVYRTVRPKHETSRFLRRLEEREIDVIAFTSSSTVSNFMETFRAERDRLLRGLGGVAIAVIGPVTRERALELGLTVHVSPAAYTIEGLAMAMADYFSSRR
jgi:uroporphyrinogen III methyltransferase/synthase